MVMVGAANRDPARFTRPDRLILDRDEGRPLSFGHGIHHCVGAALARMEAQIVLPALYRAYADLAVVTPGVQWKQSMTLRGPVVLPVRLGKRSG